MRSSGGFGRSFVSRGVAAFALLLLGCGDSPTGPAETPEHLLGGSRGITLADWTRDGYQSAAGLQAIDDIGAVGANTVVLVITAYQSNRWSSELRTDDALTPDELSVARAVSKARSIGLEAALKLHVDLDTGEWRGLIHPSDPQAWFDSYRNFLMKWSVFAASTPGVTQLVVGTEFAATLEHETLWRQTFAMVRSRFSGDILYAASWDEAPKVPFWDAVDFAGVNFYAPVADRTLASRLEILIGWQRWLGRAAQLGLHAERETRGRGTGPCVDDSNDHSIIAAAA